MKKSLLLSIVVVAIFASCNISPESKVEVLIKKDLVKSLYKPESYKPVETIVDSAFSPKDDPAFFEKLQELMSIVKEIEIDQFNQKHAKSTMSLWSGPYQSAFGRNNYNEAKENYDKATKNIEKATEKGQKLGKELLAMLNKKPEFMGWKATHNYRADDNEGKTLIGNSIYIIDKNFEKILFSCEEEEFGQIQEGIEMIKEIIEEEGS
jgi:hypothetical protein